MHQKTKILQDLPFLEHRFGRSARIRTIEATNEQLSSDILVSRVGTWNPVLGAEGLRAGICLDITHRHTSRAAYTTDFSGMMSPSSPPSPRDPLSEMSIDSELLLVDVSSSLSESNIKLKCYTDRFTRQTDVKSISNDITMVSD